MSWDSICNCVPGDLVLKSKGHHEGRIGIVLTVHTNSLGNTLAMVLSKGQIVRWYTGTMEIINEKE